MFFSLLNIISTANDAVKVDDECEYNGYNNKNLYLQVKYEYIDKNNKNDECFSIRNKDKNTNMYYKPIYKWFLSDDSCITTSDNKTYKIKVKGNITDKKFGVPIEMMDCEIVYNFSNSMLQMGYKQNSTESVDVSLLINNSNIQRINFAHEHLLFMDKIHPVVMDVKNDKFKLLTQIPVMDTFKTLRIQNTNDIIYTNFYTFGSNNDKEKLQANITGDAVFICSLVALSEINSSKKTSSTYQYNFRSFRSDNKIKIKEVPENVTFEEIEFPNEHSEILDEYEEQLPKAIEIINKAVNANVDKEKYAEILKSLCSNAFDPTICENEETIKHLKMLFDLIYSLFQALYKDQFDKGSKPLFPTIDVKDTKYIDDCLMVFNYYLSFFDKLNLEQRHQYKNACLTIGKILTTHDELKTIIADESNSKCVAFKSKINDIKLFDPIKNAQDKQKFLKNLLDEIDGLEKDMILIRTEKLTTDEQLTEMKKRYKDIKEKTKEPYAMGDKNIQMKFDSLKFEEFIAEMTKDLNAKNINTGGVKNNDIDNKNKQESTQQKLKIEENTNVENENRIEMNKDNTDVDSQKTKTKNVLLIVFGSIVGVGIVIGCGVYCYIRNKRIKEKKQYEKYDFVRSF